MEMVMNFWGIGGVLIASFKLCVYLFIGNALPMLILLWAIVIDSFLRFYAFHLFYEIFHFKLQINIYTYLAHYISKSVETSYFST